jgi:hypothetical protein
MKHIAQTFALFAVAGWLTACSKTESTHDHDHGHGPDHDHAGHSHHAHKPPHGGTPVELGDHQYHLEFVHEATNGSLRAYVMDGHLEYFVRIPAATFEVAAQVGGTEESLTFHAVANNSTGETVGNTSQFEAQAEWLKRETNFAATVKTITIKGSTFSNVTVDFPGGKDDKAGK